MPNKQNEIEKDYFSMASVDRLLKTLVKEDYLNDYERCKTEFTTVLDLAKLDLRYNALKIEDAEKKLFPRKILFLNQQKSFLEKLIAELDCDEPTKNNFNTDNNIITENALPMKVRYLLLEKFGMFEDSKYKTLTNAKKGMLLSKIFGLDSNTSAENIRQSLSNTNGFKTDENKSILNNIVAEIDKYKQIKTKKLK